MVDLVTEKTLIWDEESLGAQFHEEEVPEELAEQVAASRDKLFDTIADFDEEILERYLAGQEISVDAIRRAIRKATIALKVVPVLCGSAFKNKGVQPLLDAVIDYLPSPLDVPPLVGTNPKGEKVTRQPRRDDPLAALAFKIVTDPYVGLLTFVRVYSGQARCGLVRAELDHRPPGARGPDHADACEQARADRVRLRRKHRGDRRPQVRLDRRHALR